AKHCFAVDVATRYRANLTAVIGCAAMVAENKICFRRKDGLRIGAGIKKFFRDVGLVHESVIHVHMTKSDTYFVAGESDHALDEALMGITGIAKHDDVAALDAFPAVHHLVDEDAFLVFETRLHAAAFDFDRLVDKEDDDGTD